MESLGQLIKGLRNEQQLPLRKVAAFLDIDQAVLSKIENGQRKASRALVVKLSKYFKTEEEPLLVAWMSDKLLDELGDEKIALKALQVAEEKIHYQSRQNTTTGQMLNIISKVLKEDGRVSTAWMFGSISRGEETPGSDLDIMVEFNPTGKYSMFDLIDLAHILETKTGRKTDLVEKGFIKEHAIKSVQNDLVKIYG